MSDQNAKALKLAEEASKRASEAVKGPWRWEQKKGLGPRNWLVSDHQPWSEIGELNGFPTCDFVAAAREDVPELAAHVIRLVEESERRKELLRRLLAQYESEQEPEALESVGWAGLRGEIKQELGNGEHVFGCDHKICMVCTECGNRIFKRVDKAEPKS